jgi:hypothetical protein
MSSTANKKPVLSDGTRQFAMLVVFLGVLGSVFYLRETVPRPVETQQLDRQAAQDRYGFYLEEVSKQCGIDFIHQAPTLDPKLSHIMPIIASMGASVSVVDFDRDGWPDLYVINSAEGSKNRLYRNLGNGQFEDVAEKVGLADLNQPGTGVCMGAVWGDFDNDGFEDVLVYKWGRCELFHNVPDGNGGRRFENVTAKAGLPKWVNANSAIWLDYNRDGHLDLFIAGYWRDDINLWKLDDTQIMPESFEFANNGGRKYLLRNKGKDKAGNWLGFEDVTEAVGIKSRRWTLAVAATDLRGTGYPDLVLANDYGINEFLANHEGKEFKEIGNQTGVGDRPKSGMSVSFGDVYNQGRFSIYTTNISEPTWLLQGNNLWVPERGRTGDNLRYQNLANSLGVGMGGWSWGAQFGDLNNDGRMDLVLTNGYISANRKTDYWYDYSNKIAGAPRAFISDAANWPDMKGRSLAGYQQHCLWLNRGGKFDDIAQAVGFNDTYDGRAVVLVDLWNRGVLDVVVANQKGPLLVYKNTVVKDNAWVQFELTGTKSNKSAIGAQVTLYWNGTKQIQDVSGGSGYASQNQRRLHFGLGQNSTLLGASTAGLMGTPIGAGPLPAASALFPGRINAHVDQVVIQWPSGRTQTIPAARIRIGALNRIAEEQE